MKSLLESLDIARVHCTRTTAASTIRGINLRVGASIIFAVIGSDRSRRSSDRCTISDDSHCPSSGLPWQDVPLSDELRKRNIADGRIHLSALSLPSRGARRLDMPTSRSIPTRGRGAVRYRGMDLMRSRHQRRSQG